ncbi:basic proline-rich protein-like [Dama dama]|uniref:basic proline-rich protein-like n=1 Tax=Dama dama TaxID=30532 RepID=UPI002A35C868|nr:basic proline-rich protein-like [Dama dama]
MSGAEHPETKTSPRSAPARPCAPNRPRSCEHRRSARPGPPGSPPTRRDRRGPGPPPSRFPSQFGNRAPGDKGGGRAGGSGGQPVATPPRGSAGSPGWRPLPPLAPRRTLRWAPDPSPASSQVLPPPLGPRPWPAASQPALRPPLTGRRGPPEPPPPPGLGPSRRPPPHVPRVAIAFAATVVSPPPPLSPPPSPQSPAEAEATHAAASSRSRSPEPRGGACALRAAMGAGASRRGLGAGGERRAALGWEGAPGARGRPRECSTFRGRVCPLPSGPGRGTCRSDPPSRNPDPGWAQTSPPGQVIPPACFSGQEPPPAGRASLRAGI